MAQDYSDLTDRELQEEQLAYLRDIRTMLLVGFLAAIAAAILALAGLIM